MAVTRRHTMGNDWGGRRAVNPPDAPRVTADQVREVAELAGVEVKRDGAGWTQWWVLRPGDVWRTLGATTNYLALQELQRLAVNVKERPCDESGI